MTRRLKTSTIASKENGSICRELKMKSESRVLYVAILLLVAAAIAGVIIAAVQSHRSYEYLRDENEITYMQQKLDNSLAIVLPLKTQVM